MLAPYMLAPVGIAFIVDVGADPAHSNTLLFFEENNCALVVCHYI
jgi:hypothetical protein